MKKMLKIIGIVLLIIIILIALAIVKILKVAKERNDNYYKYSTTEGIIEKKYTAMGSLDVSSKEYNAENETIGKYVVYYPTELNKKYPVVLWANGTGSTSSTYTSFFKHLASWGFIVVGNDDQNTRSGASLNSGIDLLIKENSDSNSIFNNKIDLKNIGIGGHSQGGPAVFNMATNQTHKDMIKAVYAVSATSSYHTKIYGGDWIYDISKVNVPTLMTAGTGAFDAGSATTKEQVNDDSKGIAQGICPLWSLEENYSLLPDSIDKVFVRKTNTDHGNSYTEFDGYMTAWFMYYLQNNEEAGKAFTINGELSNNNLYQDVKTNIQ